MTCIDERVKSDR